MGSRVRGTYPRSPCLWGATPPAKALIRCQQCRAEPGFEGGTWGRRERGAGTCWSLLSPVHAPRPAPLGRGGRGRARAGAERGAPARGGSCPRSLVLKSAGRAGCPAHGDRRPGPGPGKTMAFMVKTMVGGQLKNLTGSLGGGEDKGDGDKSAAEAQGMSREEYEEYQKQLVEEK